MCVLRKKMAEGGTVLKEVGGKINRVRQEGAQCVGEFIGC